MFTSTAFGDIEAFLHYVFQLLSDLFSAGLSVLLANETNLMTISAEMQCFPCLYFIDRPDEIICNPSRTLELGMIMAVKSIIDDVEGERCPEEAVVFGFHLCSVLASLILKRIPLRNE